MFFPRLRRHAKWMFLLLALVFALGFVGFGVGAGGIGIGELVGKGGGSSGVPSISSSLTKISENPKDAQAFRDLSTAYQTMGETDNAVGALQSYVQLRPKDTEALAELAGLYLAQASAAQQQAQIAQVRQAYLATAGTVNGSIVLGGTPLVPDPITNAVSTTIEQSLTSAVQTQRQAAASAVSSYKRITVLTPRDPNVRLELASAAAQAGDTASEIAAYKAFLKLAPSDPSAPFVRSQLQKLGAGHGG